MGGSALKNLQMFQKLCGLRGFPSVILTTTMWGELDVTEAGQQIGFKRQEELQQPQFWGLMVAAGSKVICHDGSMESAYQIVTALISQNNHVVLDIVHQLVNEKKTLDETEAGKYAQKELLNARKKFERELAELLESMEEAQKKQDYDTVRYIKREREQAEAEHMQRDREQKSLGLSAQQLTQERQPELQNLARHIEKRRRASGPSSETLAREKRIRDLEIPLARRERQHVEALARERALAQQQVAQQAQKTAVLRDFRLRAEDSAAERRELRQQLDHERQLRTKEQQFWYPFASFFTKPSTRRRERSQDAADSGHLSLPD